MKKLMIVAAISFAILGCKKEEIKTQEETVDSGNPYCKCGEVVNSNVYNGNWVLDVKNNCTGNVKSIDYPNWVEHGNNVCVDFEW